MNEAHLCKGCTPVMIHGHDDTSGGRHLSRLSCCGPSFKKSAKMDVETFRPTLDYTKAHSCDNATQASQIRSTVKVSFGTGFFTSVISASMSADNTALRWASLHRFVFV
jgi:hypothetical protein